jgi:hypothetical protein
MRLTTMRTARRQRSSSSSRRCAHELFVCIALLLGVTSVVLLGTLLVDWTVLDAVLLHRMSPSLSSPLTARRLLIRDGAAAAAAAAAEARGGATAAIAAEAAGEEQNQQQQEQQQHEERMLIILGAKKAGTGTLERALPLFTSPRIAFGEPHDQLMYWSRCATSMLYYAPMLGQPRCSWTAYMQLFDADRAKMTTKAAAAGTGHTIRVLHEKSTQYLTHPGVAEQLAAHVAQMGKPIALLALLRDPVDRLLSHYQHECRRAYNKARGVPHPNIDYREQYECTNATHIGALVWRDYSVLMSRSGRSTYAEFHSFMASVNKPEQEENDGDDDKNIVDSFVRWFFRAPIRDFLFRRSVKARSKPFVEGCYIGAMLMWKHFLDKSAAAAAANGGGGGGGGGGSAFTDAIKFLYMRDERANLSAVSWRVRQWIGSAAAIPDASEERYVQMDALRASPITQWKPDNPTGLAKATHKRLNVSALLRSTLQAFFAPSTKRLYAFFRRYPEALLLPGASTHWGK